MYTSRVQDNAIKKSKKIDSTVLLLYTLVAVGRYTRSVHNANAYTRDNVHYIKLRENEWFIYDIIRIFVRLMHAVEAMGILAPGDGQTVCLVDCN